MKELTIRAKPLGLPPEVNSRLKLTLMYQPTSERSDTPPGRIEKDSISAALASAYELRIGKGYHAGTELRQDGTRIYDKKALADAVYRIYAFVHLDNMTLDEAADRVAREDGR